MTREITRVDNNNKGREGYNKGERYNKERRDMTRVEWIQQD